MALLLQQAVASPVSMPTVLEPKDARGPRANMSSPHDFPSVPRQHKFETSLVERRLMDDSGSPCIDSAYPCYLQQLDSCFAIMKESACSHYVNSYDGGLGGQFLKATSCKIANCGQCSHDGASCNSCESGYVGPKCQTEDDFFADVQTSLLLADKDSDMEMGLVALSSPTLYAMLHDGYMGTGSRKAAVELIGRAFYREYKDEFQLLYTYPHEKIEGTTTHQEYMSAAGAFNTSTLEGLISGGNPRTGGWASALQGLAHNYVRPNKVLPNGNRDVSNGHWGFTAHGADVQGMLGGAPKDAITCADPPAHSPTPDSPCRGNGDGTMSVLFASDTTYPQTSNDFAMTAFSTTELYMMGLLTDEELASSGENLTYCPIHQFSQVVYDQPNGEFQATCHDGGLKFVTPKEISDAWSSWVESGSAYVNQIGVGGFLRAAIIVVYPNATSVPARKTQFTDYESWLMAYYGQVIPDSFSTATGDRATISFAASDADLIAGVDNSTGLLDPETSILSSELEPEAQSTESEWDAAESDAAPSSDVSDDGLVGDQCDDVRTENAALKKEVMYLRIEVDKQDQELELARGLTQTQKAAKEAAMAKLARGREAHKAKTAAHPPAKAKTAAHPPAKAKTAAHASAKAKTAASSKKLAMNSNGASSGKAKGAKTGADALKAKNAALAKKVQQTAAVTKKYDDLVKKAERLVGAADPEEQETSLHEDKEGDHKEKDAGADEEEGEQDAEAEAEEEEEQRAEQQAEMQAENEVASEGWAHPAQGGEERKEASQQMKQMPAPDSGSSLPIGRGAVDEQRQGQQMQQGQQLRETAPQQAQQGQQLPEEQQLSADLTASLKVATSEISANRQAQLMAAEEATANADADPAADGGEGAASSTENLVASAADEFEMADSAVVQRARQTARDAAAAADQELRDAENAEQEMMKSHAEAQRQDNDFEARLAQLHASLKGPPASS